MAPNRPQRENERSGHCTLVPDTTRVVSWSLPTRTASDYSRRICVLRLSDDNLPNHRLFIRHYWVEAGWHTSNVRQLCSLKGDFDSAEASPGEGHLVRDEKRPKSLSFVDLTQFGEQELVKRQQQREFRRYFDSDSASVWVARPALG